METSMRRREFIGLVGGAAAWPLAARAQQPVKRLGILRAGVEADLEATNKALLDGLARLGWKEGSNLRVDYRPAGTSGEPEMIRPHAELLVRAGPDAIFATPATS